MSGPASRDPGVHAASEKDDVTDVVRTIVEVRESTLVGSTLEDPVVLVAGGAVGESTFPQSSNLFT